MCTNTTCDQPVYAKGLCRSHYARAREALPPARTCTLEGCNELHSAKGYCRKHYLRLRRNGHFDLVVKPTPYETVMSRSVPDGDCLVYTGPPATQKGYGSVGSAGTSIYGNLLTHRVVMEHHHGPSDQIVMHTCDNPPCVNIDHLRYGSYTDNAVDAARKGHLGKKLTAEKVRIIRTDTRTQKIIAAEYGISISLVSHVKSGRLWAWVE